MAPLQRVQIPSPNHYGSRTSTRLIIIHTAEGALTFQSLGSFFGNTSSQVSSQVGIDDTAGVIGEYVQSINGAWAAMNFNGVAVQAELCAFAAWTSTDWLNHSVMLDNTARWIAEEATRYGIPIVKLGAADAQGAGRGVCGHIDLGVAGGGHHDPGTSFPWVAVIAKANQYANPNPLPPETNDMDDDLFIRWCYMSILCRTVDAGGFATDTAYLKNGGPRSQLYTNLCDSPEGQAVTAARRKSLGL